MAERDFPGVVTAQTHSARTPWLLPLVITKLPQCWGLSLGLCTSTELWPQPHLSLFKSNQYLTKKTRKWKPGKNRTQNQGCAHCRAYAEWGALAMPCARQAVSGMRRQEGEAGRRRRENTSAKDVSRHVKPWPPTTDKRKIFKEKAVTFGLAV